MEMRNHGTTKKFYELEKQTSLEMIPQIGHPIAIGHPWYYIPSSHYKQMEKLNLRSYSCIYVTIMIRKRGHKLERDQRQLT